MTQEVETEIGTGDDPPERQGIVGTGHNEHPETGAFDGGRHGEAG